MLKLENKVALLENLRGENKITGHVAARIIYAASGSMPNWHDCSSYLDELCAKGIVKHVGFDKDGMSQYELC